MPRKPLVLLTTEKEFKKKLKKIVTPLALHTEPQHKVADAVWKLLLSLNEEET